MLRETELIECVLESLKAHIRNVASLETLMDSFGETALSKKLAEKFKVRIAENQRNLEKVESFKYKLYNNLLAGSLDKEEYAKFKDKYAKEIENLQTAISTLSQQLSEIQENRSEKLRWLEHFKRFENISSLDRKTVIQLIHRIHILDKKHI
jgi:iron uptake system EfeUOB component EfeO/EfeM